MTKATLSLLTLFLFCGLDNSARASVITLDFEGVADSSAANSLYTSLGVTFSGGVIVNSGAFGGSLNESEFPPRSGSGVFLNDSNTTTISFASAITSFQGFFTYGGPITLNFYNASNVLLTSLQSGFNANLALSGEPGSLPNEELTVNALNNATTVEIIIPNSDFTLDDLTVNMVDASSDIPEPSTVSLLSAGVAVFALRRLVQRPAK